MEHFIFCAVFGNLQYANSFILSFFFDVLQSAVRQFLCWHDMTLTQFLSTVCTVTVCHLQVLPMYKKNLNEINKINH